MTLLVYSLTGLALLMGVLGLALYHREKGRRRAGEDQWETTTARLQHSLEESRQSFLTLLDSLTQLQSCRALPAGTFSAQPLGEKLAECGRALLGVDQLIVFAADPDTLEMKPVVSRGVLPDVLKSLRFPAGDGPLGRAAQGSVGVRGQAENLEHGFLKGPYLAHPVLHRGRASGLLVMAQPRSGNFNAESLRLAEILAAEWALVHENHLACNDLQSLYDDFVYGMARAIDAKDHYTHDHSDRTRSLVRATAEELKLPESLIRPIEYGALLHDLGKIGVPDAILLKTGKLTPEEYDVMKTHPQVGHKILTSIRFLKPVAAVVLYHQEWYNGHGYPEGLAGEEIPLGARLVAIIDAWDAMTSDRPYRAAMPRASAIAELRRQAGTQFDPRLVDAFLRAVDRLEKAGVATTYIETHPSAAAPAGPRA